jgi:hypothetical protein
MLASLAQAVFLADLDRVPEGLDAADLKRYLLENGHELVPQSQHCS